MFKNVILIFLIIASLLSAQDFSGIRIYINPGHGGHDSDDRYIAETGFWESDGNLSKGLYLRDILNSFNATTKISRTTNNTSDDLGLSVISADANNFDADYFQSIHSNATGITTKRNTTLILFRGYDNAPVFAESKIMANILVNEIQKAHRTLGKSVRGDWDFYPWGTSGLGVLRNLTMPGTLSEGSFHDYIPESWRLRNLAYLKHEAWAITKAFINYFELESLQYGEIAGILRDPFTLVNYVAITSSDQKKPLNLVKATLLPDNRLYLGDALNNGFFMFDKVPAGTYDLILEAEDYVTDTVISITVSQNQTTFVDRDLMSAPNFSPPVIENFEPVEKENVRLDSDLVFEFNIRMDRVSVEQSLSISPYITGNFKWELNDKRMIFTPNEFFKGGTTYQISIVGFAKSVYNVFIVQPFTTTFSTRSALKLVKTFPTQNSSDISTTVKVKLKFDASINDFSLGGNVFFQDELGTDVQLKPFDEVDYENGWIIFESKDPLQSNSIYKVILLNGIKDTQGSNLDTDSTIVFTTEHNVIKEGAIISDFEEIGNWWQPAESGSTTGVEVASTSFVISPQKLIDGVNAGKLVYKFSNDSAGVCRVYNQGEPELNANTNLFGMWIFGDFSSNILEFWFRDNQGNNIPIVIDTINWTGWKFSEVDLTTYSNLKFHSMVITQTTSGEKSGSIYFDNILMDVITDADLIKDQFPSNFELKQNYPNPFNPTTTIKYSIPINSFIPSGVEEYEKSTISPSRGSANVSLIVYDVLGREINTLVHESQSPGNYNVTFDASNFPSGVYYYQLKSANFLETKKMLLLK